MKYVKENLDVVICIAVAVIALVLCLFWPTPSWDADLQARMTERYQQKAVATQLIQTVEIIPGGPKLQGATIEQNLIDSKEWANKSMNQQALRVAALAAEQNQQHRVLVIKGAGTPGAMPGGMPGVGGPAGKAGTADKYIPLLADELKEDNYLPGPMKADPFGFKTDYERQFGTWLAKLVGSPNSPGTPPTANEVQALVEARRRELADQERATGKLMGGQGGPANTLSQKETNTIKKSAVFSRAGKIRCYVDENALQKRAWFGRSVPPTDVEIFEALVDTWFQQDVVNAIVSLNNKALEGQTTDGKNVGRSPVKRLEAIVIGASALGGGQGGAGPLFMAGAPVTAGGGAAAVAAPTGSDFNRSLTGHVGTAEYDVVPMKIVVHLDPAFENAFIDALYKQNNGYTVINRNMRTVDPLEASSNGFLYGSTQVIRLELTVEGLLFRSWTVPLMPDGIRRQLGIPAR